MGGRETSQELCNHNRRLSVACGGGERDSTFSMGLVHTRRDESTLETVCFIPSGGGRYGFRKRNCRRSRRAERIRGISHQCSRQQGADVAVRCLFNHRRLKSEGHPVFRVRCKTSRERSGEKTSASDQSKPVTFTAGGDDSAGYEPAVDSSGCSRSYLAEWTETVPSPGVPNRVDVFCGTGTVDLDHGLQVLRGHRPQYVAMQTSGSGIIRTGYSGPVQISTSSGREDADSTGRPVNIGAVPAEAKSANTSSITPGGVHLILPEEGKYPTSRSKRSITRSDIVSDRSQVVESFGGVHRSLLGSEEYRISPCIPSADSTCVRSRRVPDDDRKSLDDVKPMKGVRELKEKRRGAGVQDLALRARAWEILYEFEEYYPNWLLPLTRKTSEGASRRDSLGGQLPSEWRSWPTDDFPTARIDVQRMSDLAQLSGDSEVEARWSVARAWLEDHHNWSSSPEAMAEQRRKHARALPSPQIEGVLESLVAAGILCEVPRKYVKLYLQSFVIPKPSKRRVRVILNCIPVNEMYESIPKVQLPGRADIIDKVRNNEYFLEGDGKSYFNQYTLGEEVRRFMGVRVSGRNFLWSTGPMGWSPMPYVGQSGLQVLMQDPKDADDGISKMGYIDNVYICGVQEQKVVESWERMQERCANVGATFLLTHPPQHSGTILGVFVDFKEKTISLDPKYVEKIQLLRDNLLVLEVLTHREVWKIFGNICWSTGILGIGMCCFPRFWFWLLRRASCLTAKPELWDLPVFMRDEVRKDLEALLDTILENKPFSVRSEPAPGYELYFDASLCGIGAVSPQIPGYYARPTSKRERSRKIAFCELAAFAAGLRWATRMRPQVRYWTVYTDNQNVFSWWRKKTGPSAAHCHLLRNIRSLPVSVVLKWLPSEQNLADEASRLFCDS